MTSIGTSLLVSTVSQVAVGGLRSGAVFLMIVFAVVALGVMALLGRLLGEAVSVLAGLAAAGAKVAIIGILVVVVALALLF